MNRCIIAIGLASTVTIQAFGQAGSFEFSNAGTTADRHIYVGEYMGPVKPEGDAYKIAIFWGPAGTSDENLLVQAGAAESFLSGPGAGQFAGGERLIFDPTATEDGPVITLQARGWEASTGATWEEAAANPIGAIGKGPLFQLRTKDPLSFDQPPQVGSAAGWTGFAIAVPEPSALGLALLGAAALLLFRSQARR